MYGAVVSDVDNIYWQTPKKGNFGESNWSLDKLVTQYNLELDPCAPLGAKIDPGLACCKYFFTEEEDGLNRDFVIDGLPRNVFFNGPYKRELLIKWLQHIINQCTKYPILVVGLLPAYTGADWFHDYVLDIVGPENIVFLKGRVKYWNDGAPTTTSPNFDSCLVLWRFKNA